MISTLNHKTSKINLNEIPFKYKIKTIDQNNSLAFKGLNLKKTAGIAKKTTVLKKLASQVNNLKRNLTEILKKKPKPLKKKFLAAISDNHTDEFKTNEEKSLIILSKLKGQNSNVDVIINNISLNAEGIIPSSEVQRIKKAIEESNMMGLDKTSLINKLPSFKGHNKDITEQLENCSSIEINKIAKNITFDSEGNMSSNDIRQVKHSIENSNMMRSEKASLIEALPTYKGESLPENIKNIIDGLENCECGELNILAKDIYIDPTGNIPPDEKARIIHLIDNSNSLEKSEKTLLKDNVFHCKNSNEVSDNGHYNTCNTDIDTDDIDTDDIDTDDIDIF